MRIAGYLPCSMVNGDGIRFVIFTQGCFHQCAGCQNPDTWNPDGGYEISVDNLAHEIRKHRHIDGITLSGGDPFYQQSECVRLLRLIPEYDVWIYTGFVYEEIKHTELAGLADVIVDGGFIQSLRCEGKPFGSSNQRIIRKGKEHKHDH